MLPGILSAQKLNKYWIELTDKDNSPFSVNRPAEFLSLQAIERRENARIAVDESDLPVNPPYVKAIEAVGARIHGTSRWLNAVSVIADSATATSLQKLPFVKKVQYLGPHLKIRNQLNQPAKNAGPGRSIPGREAMKIRGGTPPCKTACSAFRYCMQPVSGGAVFVLL
ncbi:MAG: hypothetical protein ACKOCH_28025 [Bacteroidota bacterium]